MVVVARDHRRGARDAFRDEHAARIGATSDEVPALTADHAHIHVAHEAFLLAQTTLQTLNIDSTGLSESIDRLNWPGRFQEIPTVWDGSVLFDAAHNPSGLNRIFPQLKSRILQTPSWVLVFGCTPQHDLAAFARPLIEFCSDHPPKHIILTQPQFGRYSAVPLEALRELDWDSSSKLHECEDAHESNALLSELQPEFAVALGSLYLIGELFEAMELWDSKHMELFPAKAQRDEA